GRAADQVRAGDQLEDSEGTRPRGAADRPRAGRRAGAFYPKRRSCRQPVLKSCNGQFVQKMFVDCERVLPLPVQELNAQVISGPIAVPECPPRFSRAVLFRLARTAAKNRPSFRRRQPAIAETIARTCPTCPTWSS